MAPPTIRKLDSVDAQPVEPQPQPQAVILQTVQSPTWKRDQEIRARAARRRDPDAHVDAQAQLDSMPKIATSFEPNEDERRYGEAHLDKDGYPQYPPFEGTYNGIRFSYPIGVDIEVPHVILEIYRHSRRLPPHRVIRTASGGVFSRDIPEQGALDTTPPDFGR